MANNREVEGKFTYSHKAYLTEFDSLDEFWNYICNTPLNEAFRFKTLYSSENDYQFAGTKSYEEATELFHNGWTFGADQLNKRMKLDKTQEEQKFVQKALYDIIGFQCSVPRYLQGIPTNMINKHMIPIKQKVITINKVVWFWAMATPMKIMDWSKATLDVILAIEKQGYRVNLNIVFGTQADDRCIGGKIRIKNANERLNISKLAFPLANPSMLRRLLFRYLEVAPKTTKGFTWAYGKPVSDVDYKTLFPNEITLPAQFTDVNKIIDTITKK